jgi:hypothetical protein
MYYEMKPDATGLFTIRVLHDGALFSRRTLTARQTREALTNLQERWSEIEKTPGRLAILVDDPDGVTHIMATVRRAA